MAIFSENDASRIPQDLTEAEVRINPDTPLEEFLNIFVVLGTLISICLIFSVVPEKSMYIAIIAVLTVLSFLVEKYLDCIYILDNVKKTVIYRRNFLGFTTNTYICDFSEIHSVAVPGGYVQLKGSGNWYYQVFLILKNGQTISIINNYNDNEGFRICDVFAQALAKHLEVNYFEGVGEQGIDVAVDAGSGNVDLASNEGQKSEQKRAMAKVAFGAIAGGLAMIYFKIISG